MLALTSQQKDQVLSSLSMRLLINAVQIIEANQRDLLEWSDLDRAMYDRLKVGQAKVEAMITAVNTIRAAQDPVGVERYRFDHPNGLKIIDRTSPFGTILIIYESRPDVTIEAAIVAFKSGNRILLKGGKEALHTNRVLVSLWHEALQEFHLPIDWVQLLEMNRAETQDYLKHPTERIDLIVPRGGERLISFTKEHASCPVLVSGRGNNFLYIHEDADWEKVFNIVLSAKINKISACNALDKVLINKALLHNSVQLGALVDLLVKNMVEVKIDDSLGILFPSLSPITDMAEWAEEYLAMKILIGAVDSIDDAISRINTYSGGHSASILTEDVELAARFMSEIDAAAVYHNASTRFTDGGEFGVGAEMAISTDKLHHRGPLGLHHLVTNKWFIYGKGQIRS